MNEHIKNTLNDIHEELKDSHFFFSGFSGVKKWIMKTFLGFDVEQQLNILDYQFLLHSAVRDQAEFLSRPVTDVLVNQIESIGDIVTIDYNRKANLLSLDYRTSASGTKPVNDVANTEGSIVLSLKSKDGREMSLKDGLEKLLQLAKEESTPSILLNG